MKYIYFTIFLLCLTSAVLAQDYESYLTGDETDAQVTPTFGVVLMGGAGENDEAMKWFLERANGGDVVDEYPRNDSEMRHYFRGEKQN